MSDRWVTIPNWQKFQHYTHRRPIWIKNYTDLLHKPEYLELSLSDRGLLHGIWLAYADDEGRLRRRDLYALVEPKDRTPDALRMFVDRSVERLSNAGFVVLSASAPSSSIKKENSVPRNGRSGSVHSDPEPADYVSLDQLLAYTATLNGRRTTT